MWCGAQWPGEAGRSLTQLEPSRLPVYKGLGRILPIWGARAIGNRHGDSKPDTSAEQTFGFPSNGLQIVVVKRKWWNWQTHHLEGVAPKGVGVQIPPSAPFHLK